MTLRRRILLQNGRFVAAAKGTTHVYIRGLKIEDGNYLLLSSFDALFDLDYYLKCFYSNRVRSEQ